MITRSKILTYSLALVIACGLASAASAAEVQLAGVKLGTPANKVLQKLGNPVEINIGTAAAQPSGQPAAGGGMGMGARGGMGGGMAASMGMGARGGMGGGMAASMGMGGMAGRAGTAAPSASKQPTTNAAATVTTWVYDYPKGKKDRELRLTINTQGIVVEIEARSAQWKGVKTSRGITFGSTYRDIIAKYGFPDSQEQQGTSLLLKYRQKYQLVFTLVPPVLGVPATVAGINIAL
jgi:hypothetical protein